jgi:hypothetical protein
MEWFSRKSLRIQWRFAQVVCLFFAGEFVYAMFTRQWGWDLPVGVAFFAYLIVLIEHHLWKDGKGASLA